MARDVLIYSLEEIFVTKEPKGLFIYYSWRVQFIIVAREDEKELFKKIQNTLNCGQIHFARGDQVRYSVQDIENLYNIVIPFFKKYSLFGKKRKDFELWAEAVNIIRRNKRKNVNIKKGLKGFFKTTWNKKDFQRLIEIHKRMQKYKAKRFKDFKWLSVAKSIAENL